MFAATSAAMSRPLQSSRTADDPSFAAASPSGASLRVKFDATTSLEYGAP